MLYSLVDTVRDNWLFEYFGKFLPPMTLVLDGSVQKLVSSKFHICPGLFYKPSSLNVFTKNIKQASIVNGLQFLRTISTVCGFLIDKLFHLAKSRNKSSPGPLFLHGILIWSGGTTQPVQELPFWIIQTHTFPFSKDHQQSRFSFSVELARLLTKDCDFASRLLLT